MDEGDDGDGGDDETLTILHNHIFGGASVITRREKYILFSVNDTSTERARSTCDLP